MDRIVELKKGEAAELKEKLAKEFGNPGLKEESMAENEWRDVGTYWQQLGCTIELCNKQPGENFAKIKVIGEEDKIKKVIDLFDSKDWMEKCRWI